MQETESLQTDSILGYINSIIPLSLYSAMSCKPLFVHHIESDTESDAENVTWKIKALQQTQKSITSAVYVRSRESHPGDIRTKLQLRRSSGLQDKSR